MYEDIHILTKFKQLFHNEREPLMYHDDEGFEDLSETISMAGFDRLNWLTEERDILKPRLEEAGFEAVIFGPGERGSNGSRVRMVTCLDHDGNFRQFTY